MVLTVESSSFARISETTSYLSLIFATGEPYENRTDFFQNSREYINVLSAPPPRQNGTLPHNNFVNSEIVVKRYWVLFPTSGYLFWRKIS